MRVILMNKNKFTPDLKKGEHYIYGPQISAGYWANPYLNKKYYIDNPIDERFPQKYTKLEIF